MSLVNTSIRARLAALLAFANLFLLAATGYAWYAIDRLSAGTARIIETQNQIAEAGDLSRRAQLAFKVQVQEWKDMLLRGHDPQAFDKHSRAFAERSAAVRVDLRALADLAGPLGLPPTIAVQALAEHEDLDRKYADAIKLYHGSDPLSARQVDEAVRGIDRVPTEHIDEIAKIVHERDGEIEAAATKEASADRRALITGLALLALFTIAVSAVAGSALIMAIARRLSRATQIARTVASGNLAEHIEVGRADEIGQLLAALRDMNGSLAGIVGRVRESAEKVSTAASQIAAGNTDLSARTEEQAGSLEETAASIEEMTATVTQNAANATQANELAASAAQVAQRGGAAVGEVVKTMDGIQASSRKIADITSVIDSIAFQTNILALNAAVEAARAGDHGRGFAVVAGEVRGLAQRSAEAAREIKGLITDSVERVDAGARLAGGAGQTMAEIVSSVNRVSQLIGEIATATREQSSGITQANQAVGELDKVTQQNAALVEESTAASESLRRLAVEMAEAVRVFRLVDAATAPAALAAPRAPAHSALARDRAAIPGQQRRLTRSPKPALESAGTVEEWKEF